MHGSTTTLPVVTTLASTMLGDVVVSDGIVYILTPCCKASAKGGERGVICRSCHRLLPDNAGWAALATDEEGPAALADLLRPSIERFADDAAARIFTHARSV
jgi:predicted Fe-S protein YdhL (DUF1289 family)